MLINGAATILQKANTKIATLGVSLIDIANSPQYPSMAHRLDRAVQFYDYLLKFIEFNDDGDQIIGTIGDNDTDLNALLVKLQNELKLTTYTLPSPIVKIITNESSNLGLIQVESSGSSITLVFQSILNNRFYAIDIIEGNKTILFSGKALEMKFYFTIDQADRQLTWPSTVLMEKFVGNWNSSTYVWSANEPGIYMAELSFNGYSWLMVMSGPF